MDSTVYAVVIAFVVAVIPAAELTVVPPLAP